MSRTEAQALAVCVNGHFYPAYEFFAGAPGIEVLEATFTMGEDVTVPDCPECGETGRILAGTFDFTENTIKLLQGPERTVEELERLTQILREAQESGASPEEVRDQLLCLSGVGPAVADLLVPTTPADFYALLAVVLIAIQMITSAKRKGQDTPIQVNQVINNIKVQDYSTPLPNSAYRKKIERNELCPCESGDKFKWCHGRSGEKRYYGP